MQKPTSSTTRAGRRLMSSERLWSLLEDSRSLVKSVCSHQRSAAPKDTFCWASWGVSRFSLHTLWGTEPKQSTLYLLQKARRVQKFTTVNISTCYSCCYCVWWYVMIWSRSNFLDRNLNKLFGILMYFPMPLLINVISTGATIHGCYGNFCDWCRVTLVFL